MPVGIAWSSCAPDREPQEVSESAAIEAILQGKPLVLLRILQIRPDLIESSWRDIMTAVASADGICADDFLRIIFSVKAAGSAGRMLNRPVDADGNRVAHWSALYGDVAKLEALNRFGADLRLANRLGTTPLFDAVRGNSPGAIKTIIHAVDQDELRHFNDYDCSPMHWACLHFSPLAVGTLHATDRRLINLPNSRGRLPLDVLEWRQLYHVDAMKKRLGRDHSGHGTTPYSRIRAWMVEHSAGHSPGWASQTDENKLKKNHAPFNADLWWNYVECPAGWVS
jgi:hypothetical protein